jgi:hypothetical protein
LGQDRGRSGLWQSHFESSTGLWEDSGWTIEQDRRLNLRSRLAWFCAQSTTLHKNPLRNQDHETQKQNHLPITVFAAQKQLFMCRFFLDSARLMTHVGTMTGKKAIRVALYSRVSTKDKGQDVRNQTDQLREFCERQKWQIVREFMVTRQVHS